MFSLFGFDIKLWWASSDSDVVPIRIWYFSSEDIILRIERNTMKFLLPTHFLLALSTPLMSAVGRGVKFNLQVQNMYDLFFVFILILFSLSRSLLRLRIIRPFRRRRRVTRSRFFSHLAPFLILSYSFLLAPIRQNWEIVGMYHIASVLQRA